MILAVIINKKNKLSEIKKNIFYKYEYNKFEFCVLQYRLLIYSKWISYNSNIVTHLRTTVCLQHRDQ
jgi:hypothetical protein